ncbi:MAG TPA: hypothetical protein VF587_09045 [Solirubrobacteraceae bacterium]|jgi:hypothetical protein
MRTRGLRRVLVAVVVAGLMAPAAAQGADHWANSDYLGPGWAKRNPFVNILAGVYCHELDSAYTRNIEINATWRDGTLYGSWVSFQTDGLRTYAGKYALSGACRNPHSVGYFFNAHDNYYV